ncbi:MAG: hypothetical protein WC662_00440 [Candidatus Paceibacterota bacterium]
MTAITAEVILNEDPTIFTLGKLTKKVLYKYSRYGDKPTFLLKYHGPNASNLSEIGHHEIIVTPHLDYSSFRNGAKHKPTLYFSTEQRGYVMPYPYLNFYTDIKIAKYEWRGTVLGKIESILKWLLRYKGY